MPLKLSHLGSRLIRGIPSGTDVNTSKRVRNSLAGDTSSVVHHKGSATGSPRRRRHVAKELLAYPPGRGDSFYQKRRSLEMQAPSNETSDAAALPSDAKSATNMWVNNHLDGTIDGSDAGLDLGRTCKD